VPLLSVILSDRAWGLSGSSCIPLLCGLSCWHWQTMCRLSEHLDSGCCRMSWENCVPWTVGDNKVTSLWSRVLLENLIVSQLALKFSWRFMWHSFAFQMTWIFTMTYRLNVRLTVDFQFRWPCFCIASVKSSYCEHYELSGFVVLHFVLLLNLYAYVVCQSLALHKIMHGAFEVDLECRFNVSC